MGLLLAGSPAHTPCWNVHEPIFTIEPVTVSSTAACAAVTDCVETGNTAADCTDACGIATATVTTQPTGGGTACTGDYSCSDGDGACVVTNCDTVWDLDAAGPVNVWGDVTAGACRPMAGDGNPNSPQLCENLAPFHPAAANVGAYVALAPVVALEPCWHQDVQLVQRT